MPVEVSDNPEDAGKVILSRLKGLALTDVNICLGDDAHDPHMMLVFGDMELNIIDTYRGMVAMVSQLKPADTARKDFHPPSEVLQ